MRVTPDLEVHETYNYATDGWSNDFEEFQRGFMLSNDYDEISEDKARELIEEAGGTNFDS